MKWCRALFVYVVRRNKHYHRRGGQNLENNYDDYIYQAPDSLLHSHTCHQPTASCGGLSAMEKFIFQKRAKNLGECPDKMQHYSWIELWPFSHDEKRIGCTRDI